MKQKGQIVFDADKHTYTDIEDNTKYTSATSWIKECSTPFVATKENTAKTMRELNMTFDEVVAHWAKKGTDSTDRGSWIHGKIEDYLLASTYQDKLKVKIATKNHPLYKEIPFAYLDKLLKKKCKLWVEDILYLKKHKIAGQSDLVLEYKNHIEIEDWKTNTKTWEALSEPQWYTKKFVKLFTNLYQTEYNKYAIQLVLYGMMAEVEYNKPCKKHTINHINNTLTSHVIDNETVQYIREKLKPYFE
jgi:hypothetical protein